MNTWIGCAALACALVFASPSAATCTGSGVAFSCTSGSTIAQIQSAYDSGTTNGDVVITLDAGSYSWSTDINAVYNKGLRITCATAPAGSAPWGAAESGGCNVSATAQFMDVLADYGTPRGTITRYYGFDGLNFTQLPASSQLIWVICDCTFTKIVIHSNSFNYSGANRPVTIVLWGGWDSTPPSEQFMYGVMYHNKLRGAGNYQYFNTNNPDSGSLNAVNKAGTSSNFFVEDNDARFTAHVVDGNCIDAQGTGGYVYRFNNSVNCRHILHGVNHNGGPYNYEFYGNTVSTDETGTWGDCFGCVAHQGSGEMYWWRNNFTSIDTMDTEALRVQHYRSTPSGGPLGDCDGTRGADGNRTPLATYRGYPCYHQPGRDFAGNLRPIYEWRNINTATNDIGPFGASSNGGSPDYYNLHIKENRDYYSGVSKDAQSNATTPFNGTVGMGFGTLANRPTTCTPTEEGADAGNGGVGYWATDQGSWNASTSNTGVNFAGEDGVLYACTATNTWTAWYTPYTYPHPLRGAVGGTTKHRMQGGARMTGTWRMQ